LTGEPIDALWVVLSYLAIEQVEAYPITPLIMQKPPPCIRRWR
jgi:predicted PurR-regulated permease PerM